MFVEKRWLTFRNLIPNRRRRTSFCTAIRQSLYTHCLITAIVLTIHVLPAHEARGQQLPASTGSAFVRESPASVTAVGPRLLSVQAPARNLWTFNAVADYEPDWHTSVFYITSFVIDEGTQNTGQLIELDYLHHRARAWPLPVGIGCWGIIKSKDGSLYMGSYNGGTLLRFSTRDKRFIPVPQLPEAFRRREFIITDVVQSADGSIYYGTYPGAHLVRYDPTTLEIKDLGQATLDEIYIRWLAVSPDGMVLCGVGPRHGRVIAYDPRRKTFRTITPARYQTPGVFSKPLVTNRFIVEAQHRPGGQLLVYNRATFQLLHVFRVPLRNNGSGNQSAFTLLDPKHVLYQDDDRKLMVLNIETGARRVVFRNPGTAANNRWYQDKRGNLLGLLVQSYVYLDRRSGTTSHQTIPIERPAQELRWLSTSPDGLIYGGPSLGQIFFSFNPTNRRLVSYDQVDDRTGEIYYGITERHHLYTISYAEAGLSCFDPTKTWNPGESKDSNPRTIAYIPNDQYRPVGGIHSGPGGNLYIGTQPDYGLLGGALSVFDPHSQTLHVYRNIIPDEEITALAADDQYVYGAADAQGGAGSKPDSLPSHLFIWDPKAKRIIWDHSFIDGRGIEALAVTAGHVYFVQDNQLKELNVLTRTLRSAYRFERPTSVPPESLKAAKDGTIFGIFGGTVGRYAPSMGTMRLFVGTADHATSGLAIGTDGAIYFGNHTSMWIYTPDHPSPPSAFGQ